jgi:hypothetical protein
MTGCVANDTYAAEEEAEGEKQVHIMFHYDKGEHGLARTGDLLSKTLAS